MRILVVEDEPDLAEAIAEGLRMDGYAVDICGNGLEAHELLFVENYDLAILDLNLPGMDGLEVLEKIRNEKPDLKILILSARKSIEDKVKGLDIGANDYLTKPFDFEELEARIRSLLRRQYSQKSDILKFDNLQLVFSARAAYIDDIALPLTKKEFSILEYFTLNQNKIISQEELMEHIWDINADSFSGAIRVHISSLRKKITAALGYDPIETRVGEGYIFAAKKGG